MVGRVRKLPTEEEEDREGQTDCEAGSESRHHRTVDVPNLIQDCLAQPSKERVAASAETVRVREGSDGTSNTHQIHLWSHSLWYLPALKNG